MKNHQAAAELRHEGDREVSIKWKMEKRVCWREIIRWSKRSEKPVHHESSSAGSVEVC